MQADQAQICIEYRSDGERFEWPWQADGCQLGRAIAILERVKYAVSLGTAMRDPFEQAESGKKICILYRAEDDTISTSIRNLNITEALEGLCEVQRSMQDLWLGVTQPIA